MSDDQDKKYLKLGLAAGWISWILFAVKFLLVTTLVALAVLFFLKKPLWIAPIIALILFALYRLVWRGIWKLIELISKSSK